MANHLIPFLRRAVDQAIDSDNARWGMILASTMEPLTARLRVKYGYAKGKVPANPLHRKIEVLCSGCPTKYKITVSALLRGPLCKCGAHVYVPKKGAA